MSRKDHPTAEVVYEHVSKDFPNISLGTVYRNLSFLVDNGMAIKVPCEDGSVHFDGNVEPHYHFNAWNVEAYLILILIQKKLKKLSIKKQQRGLVERLKEMLHSFMVNVLNV